MWGLYANMIAQLISQMSSHYIIHCHRRILAGATEECNSKHRIENNDDEASETQLCKDSWTRQHRSKTEGLVVRRFVNKVLLGGSVLLCILLAISCGIASYKLEIVGLTGLFIELGQNLDPAVRYEGVFSMAKLLADQAIYLGGAAHYIGMLFLSFLFIMTVFLVPVVQIATLVYHWLAPMGQQRRKKVALVLEILQGWQYVEVYIMAIVIQSWQLSPVSTLLLNYLCSGLDFTLNLMVYYGILEENDAQCFALEATITAGAYFMVPITFCMAVLNTFVMKAYLQQLREAEEAKEILSEDEKLRAYDRTTWDSRTDAMRKIRPALVGFVDTFRWALRRQQHNSVSSLKGTKQLSDTETYPLANLTTISSDEEFGLDLSSESLGILGGKDYEDAPVAPRSPSGVDVKN